MGLTYVIAKVRGKPGNERRVRLLVDSGATYSLLPERTWKALKLRPMREVTFSLADGTPIRRKVSECFFVLPQGQGTSPVVLGETGDAALLGVVTLESLGLVLNPFDRTLQDMKAMLV
ncbi:MAG: retropepsin-like aspartic protease [bacterium]